MILKNLAALTLWLVTPAVFAQTEGVVDIPSKTIQLLDRQTGLPLPIDKYSLTLEMKFNCEDAQCKVSAGKNSTRSEITVKGDVFQTFASKIPKLPKSGPPQMILGVEGVCKNHEKCTAVISLEQFIAASEPVVFQFDYDGAATKESRKKRHDADAQSIAEIEAHMGKSVRALTDPFDWKKLELEFLENRKKLTPMVYSAAALERLTAKSFLCTRDLSQKIAACAVYGCVQITEVMGVKVGSDIIVHGLNKAGNCAISGPVGKRYFVPKSDLALFYDVMIASLGARDVSEGFTLSTNADDVQKSKYTVLLGGVVCEMQVESKKDMATAVVLDVNAPGACKDKKVDLLYQLEMRDLSRGFTPLKMGFPQEGF